MYQASSDDKERDELLTLFLISSDVPSRIVDNSYFRIARVIVINYVIAINYVSFTTLPQASMSGSYLAIGSK